jgi:hypothetical protein
MRTTLNLPEELVRRACRASGARTKTQAIIWGLEELTHRERRARLWGLRGRRSLAVDLKKSRAR